MHTIDWETQVKQKATEAWEKIIKNEIQEFSWDSFTFNYRAEHNELVISLSKEMGKKLHADMDILIAAALLHDIGRSVEKKGHGEVGAKMAEEILKNTNFPKNKIEGVKYAITEHVGWDESIPETLEAGILRDADKLSKLGAVIILQKAMLLPFRGKNSWNALSEFNEWLKTAEYIKNNMKTKLGSKMAKERFETLKIFVLALNKEMASLNGLYF